MPIRTAIAGLAAAFVLAATLCLPTGPAGAGAGESFAFPPAQSDEEFEQSVAALAGEVIDVYQGKTPAAHLSRLFRLQLAAGRYRAADETLAALRDRMEEEGRRPPESLIGWRIYVRAKGLQESPGELPDAALEGAFSELFSPLGDPEALGAANWLRVDIERAEGDLEAARAAREGETIDLDEAVGLILRYAFVKTWRPLVGRIGPLVRADMERRFIIEDDLLIPTPDGARIAALVIRPRAVAGPLVTLLGFTIYAEDAWSRADAYWMAAHGYAGMVAYTRGKGRSPGPVVPYEHDGDDARTVIDWITQQAWSDGRVGMFGGSYNTFAQWSAAKRLPEALKAIATSASNAPGIDTPMQGNIFQNFVYPWPFFVTKTKGLAFEIYGDSERWTRLNRDWYLSGRPYRSLPDIDGEPNPVFSKWLEHPDYDSYWQAMLPYREEFAAIDIPVFVQTGYFDGGMIGALYYMRQHLKYRPDADHRMIIGPYGHLAMQAGAAPVVEGYEVDPAAMVDLPGIRLAWFDHIFRGAELPELLRDRVNFQVMGANIWRHAGSLGAMGEETVRFYLAAGQRDGAPSLSLTKPDGRGATRLTVDLADRSDADQQAPASFPGPEIDSRNAVVFESRPVGDISEVDGAFRARLRLVTNKKDLDLNISLYEKLPDGAYFPLFYYTGRASYIADRSKRRLLEPGGETELAFESEWLVARKLEPESRIVAVVGILKRPEAQINYGTGKDVSDESIADAGAPLVVDWLSSSFIELQIRR